MRDQGIGSWTARRVRMSPGQVAVAGDGGELTYRGLHERATRVANALSALGVDGGDRVAYLGANDVSFLETLFGTAMLGAIFVPLNTRLAAPELAYILSDSDARVLVLGPSHAEHALALAEVVPTVVAPAEYERLLAAAPVTPRDERVDPEDVAMIMYTSGTTGHPKGAALTHANIHWNTFTVLIDVDIAGDEVTLVNAPMFHVAALNQTVLPTLVKGGTVVLMAAFDPAATLRMVRRHRVTYLFGVPAIFQAVADSPDWADADLSSVRTLICGGAPVPETVIRRYQERGLRFLQGYGLTESSPSASFLRARESTEKVGSAGTPCFFTEVRVVDRQGDQVAPGDPGEVILHSPTVMQGYWNNPEATRTTIDEDGWLHTGDIAIVDDDGYLHIRDRIKDVIISGGENIYPAEVEEALHHHPAVADCAVIGVPDGRWGEVGRAVVVLHEGRDENAAALLDFLNGRIARYKIPKSVVLTDTLPRTASGKLLKAPLRDTYGTEPP